MVLSSSFPILDFLLWFLINPVFSWLSVHHSLFPPFIPTCLLVAICSLLSLLCLTWWLSCPNHLDITTSMSPWVFNPLFVAICSSFFMGLHMFSALHLSKKLSFFPFIAISSSLKVLHPLCLAFNSCFPFFLFHTVSSLHSIYFHLTHTFSLSTSFRCRLFVCVFSSICPFAT